MSKNNSIAETHSIDLNNFEIRKVTVKQITVVNILYGLFLLLIASIFVIMAICNRDSTLLLSLGMSSGTILLILACFLFLDIFSFKVEFKEEKIYYRHFFKGLLFNVSDIKCFGLEMDSLVRYYRIQLILDNDKKIKYTIAQENKENLIFLLNLLKMGIEQI